MKTSLQTVLAATALIFSSSVLAAPKAQTAPPPPPPVSEPVCDLINRDGTTNAGVDVGDSAYAAVDLQDNGQCTVSGPADPENTCSRVSCDNTSGIFLCANSENPPPTGCDFVAGLASNIRSTCGDTGQTEGVSGYVDQGPYRVYVAYANCNVASDASVFEQHT